MQKASSCSEVMMLYASTVEIVCTKEALLDDFVLDETFVEVSSLLDDTLLEVLLVMGLLDEDNLLEEILLGDGLLVEVFLDEVLTTGLLLDLVERVDEVFGSGFFEEDEDDLRLNFLVELGTNFVLGFVSVVGLSKTHLQACLTAGTFKLGIGESCLSLGQAVSTTFFFLTPKFMTYKESKKEQNEEESLNSLLIGLPEVLEHVALTKFWRRAALAIASRLFAFAPAGSTLVMHLQAVNKALAPMF